jgi:hypothetical protein
MFRATMCPASGETAVFMRHLVLVILYGWLSGIQGAPCIPEINILKKSVPSWLYLQDYTRKHGQRNINYCRGNGYKFHVLWDTVSCITVNFTADLEEPFFPDLYDCSTTLNM